MLGIAAYDSGDSTTAAEAFDKVPSIGSQFKPIAADSLATAAVKMAQDNPTQSLEYAQKAVALQSSDRTRTSRWAWRNWPTTSTPTPWHR